MWKWKPLQKVKRHVKRSLQNCVPAWFTCQKRANVSILRAIVTVNVPIFQLGVQTCRKVFQFFKYFSYEMPREIYILYYCIKNSTLYLISCIVHKNCYTSFLYSIPHVYGIFLFSFFALQLEITIKQTWFLYVTSNKVFLEFSAAKTTKQNKEYVWIFWSSWIVICLSWRSDIVKRNLTVTMFLSVSCDYVFEYCSS